MGEGGKIWAGIYISGILTGVKSDENLVIEVLERRYVYH